MSVKSLSDAIEKQGYTVISFLAVGNEGGVAALIHALALRGAGNSRTPMFIMLFSYVLFRRIYLYIMSHYLVNRPIPIALGYPAGWAVCSLLIFFYYRKADLARDCVVDSTAVTETEAAAG